MAFDPSERDYLDSIQTGVSGRATDSNLDAYRQDLAALGGYLQQEQAQREAETRRGLFGTPIGILGAASLPFLGPAIGLGALHSAALGAATGAGWSAAGGADPLIGGITGGIGGGLASLGAAGARPDSLLPAYTGGSSLPAALRGSVNATASALGAYQDRPDYDPDRPEPDEPPLLDIIIGAPPAPPIDIPPPRLPEEGPVGGGGGGSGGGEPTPIPEDRPEGGREEGVGTGGNWYPCDTSPTGWCYEGQEDQDPIDIDLLPLPGAGGGVDVPATPTPNADVGGGQGAGDGQGAGTGTGGGSGSGAGEGSGSGDGSGDGDGSGMDLDSMLGMLGLLAQPGAQVTAETPEGADIKIYDLENMFGVSGLDRLYNAPFEDELTLITEELLKAARERR